MRDLCLKNNNSKHMFMRMCEERRLYISTVQYELSGTPWPNAAFRFAWAYPPSGQRLAGRYSGVWPPVSAQQSHHHKDVTWLRLPIRVKMHQVFPALSFVKHSETPDAIIAFSV